MPSRRYQPANSRSESSLNVTPLADVSLSLLLGFMVITPIIFQTLSATLPQGAGVASGKAKPDPLIEYTATRQILLNGKETTLEELPERLEEFFPAAGSQGRKIMFTGSGELPYADIVTLLDALRSFGIDKIGIR